MRRRWRPRRIPRGRGCGGRARRRENVVAESAIRTEDTTERLKFDGCDRGASLRVDDFGFECVGVRVAVRIEAETIGRT